VVLYTWRRKDEKVECKIKRKRKGEWKEGRKKLKSSNLKIFSKRKNSHHSLIVIASAYNGDSAFVLLL
jgi:hypothetical protein